ncbi:MAG TPA: hypothetical protein VGM56_11135 [Byssovorax sp.]|jgi:hypothetical protein
MNRLRNDNSRTRNALLAVTVGAAALALTGASALGGCGGDTATVTGSAGTGGDETGGTTTTHTGTSTNSMGNGTGGHTTGTTMSGSGGNPSTSSVGSGGHLGTGGTETACTTDAVGPTRGAAIAITPDDSRVVSVNRGSGSVTVFDAAFDANGIATGLTEVTEIPVGNEPWQVAIDGCGTSAYVVLRADQKIVRIDDLLGTPTLSAQSVVTGSEPTSIAIDGQNKNLYVANWVDGTVGVYDPATLDQTNTIDLNAALVGSPKNYFGATPPAPRAAIAHPRSIAITNTGANDHVYVTEFFGQRIAPEPTLAVAGAQTTTQTTADTTHEGVLYSIASDGTVKTISLSPMADTGFNDQNGAKTGCYPNQLEGVTVNGNFAYVTAICASPQGPQGVSQKNACTTNADCTAANPLSTCDTTSAGIGAAAGAGACTLTCTLDSQCGAAAAPAGTCVVATGACKPITVDVKTSTHPTISVVDTTSDTEVAGGAVNLNLLAQTLYTTNAFADDGTRRFPLVANEMVFVPGGSIGYLTANGADAVFRFTTDANGVPNAIGASPTAPFIDLANKLITDTTKLGQGPVGLVITNAGKSLFTDNTQSLNVTAVDLANQGIAGGTAAPVVGASTTVPVDPTKLSALKGKRFFETGMGRWSAKGQGWGACQSCHIDGLTDNVTWYFNRGPRQSISLDGTFDHATGQQRILNWTGIFDEVADFENNTRGVSGGVGALVETNSTPAAVTDRLNLNDKTTLFPPASAFSLNGSTNGIDQGTAQATTHTVAGGAQGNWKNIQDWIQLKVRSPKAPTNVDSQMVADGLKVFKDANCQGCHGGTQWTSSKLFYLPTDGGNTMTNTNEILKTKSWASVVTAATTAGATWPQSMLPATGANQNMRNIGAKAAAFDQIVCVLRPVGTMGGVGVGVGSAEINVQEVRQDQTAGQGAEAATGNGFNPPSLLNLQAGAPYFHAGNARTLEEMFQGAGSQSGTFKAHNFAIQTDANALGGSAHGHSDVDNLIAYLISIDENTMPIDLPMPVAQSSGGNMVILGGDFCSGP